MSDYRREPFYNWNPPTRNTLVAVCKTDIDDQNEIDDQFEVDENDLDIDPQQQQHNVIALLPAEGHFQEPGNGHQHDNDITMQSVEGHFQVHGNVQQHDNNVSVHASEGRLQLYGNTPHNTVDAALVPAGGHFQVQCNISQQSIPQGISKITELTLDLFDNNYHLFAKKISSLENGLFIRVILLKSNKVIFNFTYKIIGTENVCIATIVSADRVCNLYLLRALKKDTFLCSLGDGHDGVRFDYKKCTPCQFYWHPK